MTSIQSVLLILLVVVIAAVLLWLWFRSHTYKQAAKQAASLAREVFPVWAAQGPFQSGAESEAAMRYAFLAVMGPEKAERIGVAGTFANHASAYDSDPTTWERTRQVAAKVAGAEIEKFVTIAKGLAAMDSLNKDFLERGGYKLKHAKGSVEDTLEWSSNPGAHEAHLIRRNNNPYFPESRRRVSKEELLKAKRMDNDGYILCQQRLAQLLEKVDQSLVSGMDGDVHKFRKDLDKLILFSMGVGGPAKEVASEANRMRDDIISGMRAASSNDKVALENIEKADAYHMDNTRKFYIPVMAQIVSKRSPIPKEETIAAILSEEPESIAIFMSSLPEDDRPKIRLGALKLMQEVLHHGHVDPQFEEKVSALEGKWHFK